MHRCLREYRGVGTGQTSDTLTLLAEIVGRNTQNDKGHTEHKYNDDQYISIRRLHQQLNAFPHFQQESEVFHHRNFKLKNGQSRWK